MVKHFTLTVSEELERCKPWILAALDYSGNTHNWDDIVEGVQKGTMQLWPASESCMVTEIVDYPRKRLLNIFLAGGKLPEILNMQDSVREWAKREKCDGGMISGRKGWQKPLEKIGWKHLHCYYVKEMD